MNDIEQRISASFRAQGLMATIGATLEWVQEGEFKVNLLRPASGHRFLALGRVQNAGRLLTVCTGEVRAFSESTDSFKVVALMQATFVNVGP